MYWEIAFKIIASLASAAILALLAFAWRGILDAILFVRAEYDLTAEREAQENPFSRTWDITWEKQRLTFRAGDISDNEVSDAEFKVDHHTPETFPHLFPRDSFRPLFRNQLAVKINSIVRRRGGNNSFYMLRLVLRRRRRILN